MWKKLEYKRLKDYSFYFEDVKYRIEINEQQTF